MRSLPFGSAATRITAAVLLTVAVVAATPPTASAHAPHDEITDLAVPGSFTTDGVVLVVSRNHLMRSVDGGFSYRSINRGVTGHRVARIAVAPSDSQVAYLRLFGRGAGLQRSADGGLSWEPATLPAAMRGIDDLEVSPGSTALVVAAGPPGLFLSTDGSRSWTPAGPPGPVTEAAFSPTGRLLVATAAGDVVTSDDGGTTWSSSTLPDGPRADPVTAFAATPGAPSGIVFAGTGAGRLLRSTDDGTTFTEVGSGLPGDRVTSVALSHRYDVDHALWVATWTDGVYRSTDEGGSFTRTSSGLTTDRQAVETNRPQFGHVTAGVDGEGRQVLFVGGFDGLFRSDDGGDRWREVQTLAEHLVGLAVSPGHADDSTVVATTYVKGAYISTDAGASWRGSHTGLGASQGNRYTPLRRLTNVHLSPSYPLDGTMFTAAATSVFRSTDRGASWTDIPMPGLPDTGQQLFVIALSPSFASDRTVYTGSRHGQIHRSRAAGEHGSWTLVADLGSQIRSLVASPGPATDGVLYAGAIDGVYKSSDGGERWTHTGLGETAMLAVSPDHARDRTIFAGTAVGVFVSRDAGATWTRLVRPPLRANSHVKAIAVSPTYASDGTVLVSVQGEGLYRSTDRGATFTATGASLLADNLLIDEFDNPTSSPIQYSPTYVRDRTVYGMAQQFVVRSTDGGTTWSKLELPPASALLEPPVVAAAPGDVVVEGPPGERTDLMVPFDLSHPAPVDVTVRWRTVDIPDNPLVATSTDGDFVAASGTLTFPRGASRRYATVTVLGDEVDEENELVVLATEGATNATIGGIYGLGFGIVTDDDGGT